VRILKEGKKYALVRNGEKFFIKGAVGHDNFELIRESGGNAVNIYHQFISQELLDRAHACGLAVVVTLDIGRPHYGVDYSDERFVSGQRAWVEELVTKYKGHPAILFWVIGNEIHLHRFNNIAAWKEVNRLSEMIHRIDPDHLTTTALGEFPRVERQILQIKFFCPDLDFICFNSHMRNYLVRREVRNFIWGWDGPYVVTEWTGFIYWHNNEHSDWGAVIEPSSTYKAQIYYHNYGVAILRDPDRCMGGFVFYWGEKQERTHTMFSMILDGKYKTQSIEMVRYYWQNTWPDTWCPKMVDFRFHDFDSRKNIYLKQGQSYRLNLSAVDPDGDYLWVKVQVMEEGKYRGIYGGDRERKPPVVSETILNHLPDEIWLDTPEREGAFRVYVYVCDTEDNVAVDNIPFYVLPI
jgi:hypothetical protein